MMVRAAKSRFVRLRFSGLARGRCAVACVCTAQLCCLLTHPVSSSHFSVLQSLLPFLLYSARFGDCFTLLLTLVLFYITTRKEEGFINATFRRAREQQSEHVSG